MTNTLDHLGAGSTSIAPPASKWKTRVALPACILIAIGALLALTSAHTLLPATEVHVVPVVIKNVEVAAGVQDGGGAAIQAPGWLEPEPHPYYVAALAPGVVREVTVLAGDRVSAGEVVAYLVDDDAKIAVRRATAEVMRREAELEASRADVLAARLALEHLIEPSRRASIARAATDEAEAELQRVDADRALEEAKLLEIEDELERKSKLEASQAVSEATLSRLRLRQAAQRAAVDAVKARRAVSEAKLDQARADVRAADKHLELLIEERQVLALAEASEGTADAALELAKANLADAQLQLERMAIRSPVDGIVMRRLVSPGSGMMLEGAEHALHVVHLYDPARLQVRVDVPLADAAHVAVGQRAEITVEALPDQVFTGTVLRVVHEADIQKNTVEVKVGIDEPSEALKPEMLARVKLMGGVQHGTGGGTTMRHRLFVPESLAAAGSAIVVTDVVDGRGRAERRELTVGDRHIEDWVEVTGGLHAGDLLVADHGGTLDTGDRVRIIGELDEIGGERWR